MHATTLRRRFATTVLCNCLCSGRILGFGWVRHQILVAPLCDTDSRMSDEDEILKENGLAEVEDRRDSPSPTARSASPEEKGRDEGRSRSKSGRRMEHSRSPVARDKSRSRSRDRSRSRERRRRSISPLKRSPRRYRSPSPRRYRSPSPRRYRSPSPRRYRSRSRDRGYGRRRSPYGGGRRYRSPPPPRRRRTPPSRGLHLFVAGLNFITTEREVQNKFEKYGDVVEARIVRNPVNGESRGFGFCEMRTEEGVDKAIRALDGEEWHGRRLLVERARNIR